MNEAISNRRLKALLSVLNIRVKFQYDADIVGYVYKNKQRIILVEARWDRLDNINFKRKFFRVVLHDIGHFLVAPPQRRKLKDFGIPESKLNNIKWIDEDNKASIIEWDLSEYVGVNPGEPKSLRKKLHKQYEKWYNSEGKMIAKTIIDLAKT